MSEDFRKCCRKPALDTLPCLDDLERQSRQQSNVTDPVSSELCGEVQPNGIDRCSFNIHQIFGGRETMHVLKERSSRKYISAVS